MERHDRSGILGTPLLSDPSSAFKLSLQNRIAPTPAAYSKLRHNVALRKERRLLDDSVQLATKDGGLYPQNTRSSPYEDVLDDEDRAYLRLRAMISKKRRDNEEHPSSCHGNPSSFLLATVDFPEISSKQARTPLGYRELQIVYSLRPEETSQVHNKKPSHSDYDRFGAVSLAALKDRKSGSGYGDKRATDGAEGDIKTKAASDTFGFREGLESAKRGTDIGYESDDEDYINHPANFGYKNLDATEKLMSRKLKEGRTALTMKGPRKRTLSDTDGTDFESVMFTAFIPWRAPDKQDTKWTEYVVPASFAAYPSHDFEKDHLKTTMNVLPPLLQQEYRAVLRVYKEAMSEKADAIKTSIAKATEKHKARLHRIRGLVLEDMGARFIAPQAAQKARIPTSPQPHPEEHVQHKGHSTKHPNQGETNRTVQHWKPENLLCKRLGVEEPKKRESSIPREEKAPMNKFPGSHSTEDFQIHSITNQKGTRTDASGDDSLLQGGIALAPVDCDEEVRVKDDRIRPSRDLIQTIFVNPHIEDEEEFTRDASTANKVNTGTVPRMETETRGLHKTRAVDFF